jgi:hypothetical protein
MCLQLEVGLPPEEAEVVGIKHQQDTFLDLHRLLQLLVDLQLFPLVHVRLRQMHH